MKNRFWENVPEEYQDKWKQVFNNCKDADIMACPICGGKALHRYFNIIKKIDKIYRDINYIADGDEWQWCSECRHYEHFHTMVPAWWNNKLIIDGNKLTAVPSVIDLAYKNPDIVQRWNSIPDEYMKTWQTIFENNSSNINVGDKCPICDNKTLHQYFTIAKLEQVKYKKKPYKGIGASWQWCSSCFHYRFMHQAYVPMDWVDELEVETWNLMPIPEPIDEELKKLI